MATRGSSSDRPRTRRSPGGRKSSAVPPGARARPREADDASRSTQRELLQGVQQVWLAGMGAIARAQKEGPAAFSDAVLEGVRLLNTSRSVAQRMVRDAFETAQETLQSRVGGAREQAQDTWDGLESLFQTRVQRAMHQLGVPTGDEIRTLADRVAELNESVQRIDARDRSRAPATRARRAGAKAKSRRKGAKGKSRTE